MGPKTLRRLVIAAVVLVLGVVSIFLLQRYQLARMGRGNIVQAEEAVKAGDLTKAEDLYLQHVLVFPTDDESQIAYAKVLLERSKTPARITQASQIYKDVLNRGPGRDDVRRLLSELLVDEGRLSEAGPHLMALQSKYPEDGDLAYLLGRTQQEEGRDQEAVESYRTAIVHKASKRFDARQRIAMIYRGPLNQPEEADRVIDEMVQDDPDDFHVYLERGRYRARVGTSDADLDAAAADYRQALKLAPKEPDGYLELAQIALRRTPPNTEEASRILQEGLEADPRSGSLYTASAMLDLQSGDVNAGLKTLRRGLEMLPDDAPLRVTLAEALAVRGATIELRDQIQELTRLGMGGYTDYYTAYLYVNMRDWSAAKKVLQDQLLPKLNQPENAAFRAKVNTLLARCYANLGEPERQRTALAAANRDDPRNLTARLTWIADLAQQGETSRAIEEYAKVADSVPAARLPLIQLLITRNRRLPVAQRDWSEAERLVEAATKDDPSSSRPILLRAQILEAKGNLDEAAALLDSARSKNPNDSAASLLWAASADVFIQKRDFAGALKVLDEAKDSLGDSVELRLARLKVLTARRAPDIGPSLIALTQGIDALPIEKRIAILDAVGDELNRRNLRDESRQVWTQYAEIAPNDTRPRIQLLGMAFANQDEPNLGEVAKPLSAEEIAAQASEIESNLQALRRIEGPEGYLARYGDIEYLLWKARQSKDGAEKTRLRSDARSLLSELRSRRADWSVVPLTTARLEEQELEDIQDPQDRQVRINRLADLYRQAVEMGQRNLRVVQKATERLIEAGRTAEVGQLWNKVPILGGDGGDTSYLAASILEPAIKNKEYDKAIEIVRQRIALRPNEFSQRILLARLLLWEQRPDEAEAELRQALSLEPSDPNRHIVLVQFLVSTGQIEKAEEAASRIEAAVGSAAAPLAMASCSDMIAQGCQATARDAQKAKWLESARNWYAKAQAARPGDFAVKRAYVEFLLRSNLVDDAEKTLTAFLKPPAGSQQTPTEVETAWARRTLALTYVARSESTRDYQQALKALYLYAPPDQADWKPSEEPEDLSALARVYEAQKLAPYRRKAIDVLEKLDAAGRATDDDRFLLGRLYKADGKWDEAHAEFSRLMQDSDKPASYRDLNQYVIRIVHFTSELINHIKIDGSKAEADAAEAQALIDRLRNIQPSGFNVVALQARLDKAVGKDEQAAARIKEITDQANVQPALMIACANLAEELGFFDMAENLLQTNATTAARLEDQLYYATFLGRRGRVQQALDVCEPHWKSNPNPEIIAPALIGIVLSPANVDDKAQLDRVGGWIERSLEQKPDTPLLTIALATIRDRQQRYDEAVTLYRKAVEQRGADVIPLNNLAWLMTLQGDTGSVPLELINRAISLRGPVPEFLDTRAVVQLANGETQNAIEDLNNAIAISPSAGRYFHLARAYMEAGDLDAAKSNLDKARGEGLGPNDIHPLERATLAQMEKLLK